MSNFCLFGGDEHTHTHTHLSQLSFFTVMSNSTLVASEPNPAVGTDLLKEILLWKLEGCSDDDIVVRLRQRAVPNGYEVHGLQVSKIANMNTLCSF